MSNNSYNDVPELGDYVTFVSTLHGKTKGRIIYRDGTLIRVKPRGKGLPVDFPLDADGLFDDAIGVQEVIIHEKRTDPHFSMQLGVFPGDTLDLLNSEGKPLEESGAIVHEVIATEYDALKLHDGTVLDFNFRGPPPGEKGLVQVVPRLAPQEPVSMENEGAVGAIGVEGSNEEEEVPVFFDESLLPVALVEEVSSSEVLYSDASQRENMFNELLLDESETKQRDPNVMAQLYRTVDLLMALKNSVLPRDRDGGLQLGAPTISYTARTIQESIQKQPMGAPLAAVLPVIGVQKVLYMDELNDKEHNDVLQRSDSRSLLEASSISYNEGVPRGSILFGVYMNRLLNSLVTVVPVRDSVHQIEVDQDVLRSKMPPAKVDGFPRLRAGFTAKGDLISLKSDEIDSINSRSVRLLSASRIQNPTTGETILVAPADTADTIGHIMLSPELASRKAPIRSSVLLWDIEASQRSRSQRESFYSLMTRKEAEQTQITADTLLVDELTRRLSPEVNLWNRSNMYVLDSLGLRALELTEELLAPLLQNLERSQSRWNEEFEQETVSAAKRMEQQSLPVIAGYATLDSSLFIPVVPSESFQTLLTQVQDLESSFHDFDLAVATHLLKNEYLTSFWYATVAGTEEKDQAETLYKLDENRQERITAVQRNRTKEFTAKPVLNSCPHRREYEKIMAVRNDAKRFGLLEPFLKKYKGVKKDNWIQCNRCQSHLVCQHEILLLREFKQQDRSEILHKTLLMDFMSPFVFEGSFICKNCGQKIQDIEYDNHAEWGANGPMVGRSVVEEEEEDIAIKEKDPFPKEDMNLYTLFRSLFEICGMFVDHDVYLRSIETAKEYMKIRVTPEKAKRLGVPFNEYEATCKLGIVGAILVIELQTFEKEITIPSPLCLPSDKEKRRNFNTGFPLDGKTIVAGTGALDYISCILASIQSKEPPFTELTWRGIQQGTERIKQSTFYVRTSIFSLLGWPSTPTAAPEPPLGQWTELYTLRLFDTKGKKHESGAKGVLSSMGDRVPPAFRPLPAIILPSETPVGNVETFLENVKTASLPDLLPIVKDRQFQLTQQGIATFHTDAKKTALGSVCCYRRLAAVGAQGFGVHSLDLSEPMREESKIVDQVATEVAHADITKSACGTHIYVPWSAPPPVVIEANTDESEYYALFLKTCYSGHRKGLPHEFGSTHRCRNCGFRFPKEILFMAPADIAESDQKKLPKAVEAQAKQRKEVIVASFAEQQVEITETTFRDLEMKIRERKRVAIVPPVSIPSYLDSLQSLNLSWLLPSEQPAWALLLEGLLQIQTEGIPLGDIRRLAKFAPFEGKSNTVKPQLKQRLLALVGAGKSELIDTTFAGVQRLLTPVDGVLSVRTILDLFVVSGGQISTTTLGHERLTQEISSKWVPNISFSHKQDLSAIWTNAYSESAKAIKGADSWDEPTKNSGLSILKTFADAFGTWLQVWSQAVRPEVDMTMDQYKLILDWMVHSSLLSLLSLESPLYRAAEGNTEQIANVLAIWIINSSLSAHKLADKYQLSREQIKSIIDAMTEAERNKVIAEFDELGDLRQVELVWKRNKVGRWGRGANLFTMDPDVYEAQKRERGEEVAGDADDQRMLIYQLNQGGGMDDDTNLRARQDEDEGGADE